MKRSRFILLANVAFLLGIFFASLSFRSLFGPLELFYLLFVVIFLMLFFKMSRRVVISLLVLILVGFLRFLVAWPQNGPQDLAYYHDEFKNTQLLGCIEEELDLRRDHIKITLTVYNLIDSDVGSGFGIPVRGKLLVTLPKYPKYYFGDCLKVSGVLQAPGEFDGFSYDDYLRRYGINSVMYRPYAKVLDFRKNDWFRSGLFALKFSFESRLNSLLHEPHSSFAAGLITGSRKGIPDFVMEVFNTTGLTHIIAISGYNITLLIVIISALFAWLPRLWRFALSVLTIIVFTLFVGSSAAVVRAAIMGVIALMALQFGRKSLILLILFMSALIMNLYNPYILVFDVGFQLSFSATLGLIVFGDRFSKYFEFLPNVFAIRESMVMTLAAQVFTLPLIIFHFSRFSLISPLANVLTGPLIPWAMLFSFLAVLSDYVWSGFGLFFAYLAWIFLELIMQIATWLSTIPYANLEF